MQHFPVIFLEELSLLLECCSWFSASSQLWCCSAPGTSMPDALSQFGDLNWHKSISFDFCFWWLASLNRFTECLHRDRLVNLKKAGLWQGLLPRSSALFSPGGQLGREQGSFRSASTWRAAPGVLTEPNGPPGTLQILSSHLTNSN